MKPEVRELARRHGLALAQKPDSQEICFVPGGDYKKFLDAYYSTNFTAKFVEQWTISGTPASCAQQLRAYAEAGLGHMALRLASWDQRGQLTRLLEEVLPAYAGR